MNCINCVVIGDTGVGKTSLLRRFASSEFPKIYIPTIFDHFSGNLWIDENELILDAIDTSGEPEYDQLNTITYKHAQIFIFCFSLSSSTSLENIKLKWYPKIYQHSPGTPIVLVGTKSDERKNGKLKTTTLPESIVTSDEGKKVARSLHVAAYFECSALEYKGIWELFDEIARIALKDRLKNTD